MNTGVPEEVSRSKPDRALMVILAIIAVIIATAVVLVVVRGSQPREFDASTPEGVVQLYSQAVINGDKGAAMAYLDSEAWSAEACEGYSSFSRTDNLRVTIQDAQVTGSTAIITVTITEASFDGPFSNSEYSNEAEFELSEWDGSWRIRSAPYQLSNCNS
ncbi:MAG: hypothetical protein ACOH1T_01545 [Microbacteriaceae bacterium]